MESKRETEKPKVSVVALVVQKLVIVRSANDLDFAFNSSGRLGDGASATQAVSAGGGLVKSPNGALGRPSRVHQRPERLSVGSRPLSSCMYRYHRLARNPIDQCQYPLLMGFIQVFSSTCD